MLDKLTTEQRNKNSMNLDELSTLEIIELMNKEDSCVIQAVNKELVSIEKVIEETITCLRKGGRLLYVGAGTSGRIGMLDAVECPPTFGLSPDKVIGILAGGTDQIYAKEEAEDSYDLGYNDMIKYAVTNKDIVIGIAASGRTPYVMGALDYANSVGASSASIACNKFTAISKHAKLVIEVDNGPEIVTGSTRLKAGTAQKMICNMITTASMIRLGKVYENLMVDVDVSNEKLQERWYSIVMQATNCSKEEAIELYNNAKGNAKAAICMCKLEIDYCNALLELEKHDFIVKDVSKAHKQC